MSEYANLNLGVLGFFKDNFEKHNHLISPFFEILIGMCQFLLIFSVFGVFIGVSSFILEKIVNRLYKEF